MNTPIKMSSILCRSLWKVYVYIFLIYITTVVSFQKNEKRNCKLFVPLDESLSTYSQYDSDSNKGKSNA